MGWKNFKEKFNIHGHHVHVRDGAICIGSGYVPNLVEINMQTGAVKEHSTFPGFLKEQYPELLKASTQEILDLITKADTFNKSIPVYSYEGHKILEDAAEEYGYPNVTHSGEIMYENVFFKTREEAIKSAKINAEALIHHNEGAIKEYSEKIYKLRRQLEQFRIDKAELDKLK